MLKAAIEKIVSLSTPQIYNVGNNTFASDDLVQVRPELDLPHCIELNSLDALVKLVKNDATAWVSEEMPLFITVPSYEKVSCFTAIDSSVRNHRMYFYDVRATDVPGWNSETKLAFEQAAIALQTRFQDTQDRAYTLRLCSQITSGGKVTYNDNGVATSVVTQKGVALQGAETIKPLVKLKPYRTFQEVDQPEGLFLIRIDERGISFIEADGGMWKLAARKTIKAYLEHELAGLVEAGKVTIAL